jgi:hypothetical protein
LKEWIRKTIAVVIGGVGYILSPLSWWNDLYVNIPIAYFVASLISPDRSRIFTFSLAGAYWFTNALGLVLMQVGGTNLFCKPAIKLNRRGALTWLAWSLIYTLALVLLCQIGLIRPLPDYLQPK